MQVIRINENTLSNVRKRLTLDFVCWISAAVAVWYYGLYIDFPVASALAGATGIVYLKWAVGKYQEIKFHVGMAMMAIAEMQQQMERRAAMTDEERKAEDDAMMMELFGTTDEDEIERKIAQLIRQEEEDGPPNP